MRSLEINQVAKLAVPLLLLLTSCGSPDTPKPTSLGSPKGSVPFGEKAYSPDGKMYVREVDPKDHGKIGIYDLAQDKRLKVLNVKHHSVSHYPNDLKGVAWSPDSKSLAVMYHYDRGGHISIVDVESEQEIKSIPIHGNYHSLAFSKDGAKLYAETSVFDAK